MQALGELAGNIINSTFSSFLYAQYLLYLLPTSYFDVEAFLEAQ